ncbi:MAG: hypothetical protein EZS28_018635, partial [Streblomastix strix]
MFNKLLLVYSFCAFVLSKKAVIVDDEKDIPKHNPDIAQIGRYSSINVDDVLVHSYYCDAEDGNQSWYNSFDLKSQQPAPTFMAISEANITGLKIGQEKSQEEEEEFSKCYGMSQLRREQELIAYYANFIDQVDIIPSLTYLVSNAPKFYSNIKESNGITYRVKRKIDSTCEDYSIFWDSVFHNGIVDQSCIPENFASIPGYDRKNGDPYPSGSPDKIEKCFNGG